MTFFGVVQKVYILFHGSTERWVLLKDIIGDSLHPFSSTRWSARIQSVRPFAAHLPELKRALHALLEFNLTAEARAEVQGCVNYISSFKCILMSSIWFKALTMIDYRSKVLQMRSATLDVEVENIDGLIRDLENLRAGWSSILEECKAVAVGLNIEMWPKKRKRGRKRFFDELDEPEEIVQMDENDYDPDHNNHACGLYKSQVFYRLLDNLLKEMKNRYNIVRSLDAKFGFLWKYLIMKEEDVQAQALTFAVDYTVDISGELVGEMLHLKAIHRENLGKDILSPLHLLNRLSEENLDGLFPNVCVALRLFCTLPVSVAGAERSFSGLATSKDDIQSTMSHKRLSSLGMLYFYSAFARQLSFEALIHDFANNKARKVRLS